MLGIILSGLVASLMMVIIMQLITLSGIANANMVQAIGGLVTRKRKFSVAAGLLIYFSAGIMFAFLYETILTSAFVNTSSTLLVAGSFLGFAHGLVVGSAIVIEAAGRHPLPEYRNAGFSVALAHILGHIVYGATIALMMLWKTDAVSGLVDTIATSQGALFAVAALIVGLGFVLASAINHTIHDKKHSAVGPNSTAKASRDAA